MLLPLVLTVLAAPPAATSVQAQPPGEEAFLAGYAEVRERMERRRWRRAYDGLRELLAEHAGADYALDRVAEIEADLKRCAFWREHDEPELDELLEAEVKRWDAYRGDLVLVLRRDGLGDLVRHDGPAGALHELPARWDGPWTATFEGAAEDLLGTRLYVLLGPGEAYFVRLGLRNEGLAVYTPHVAYRVRGGVAEEVARAVPEEREGEEEVRAEVLVSESRIRLRVDAERVLSVRRDDDGGLGRAGVSFDLDSSGFDELELDGRIQSGWADGVVDAAVQEARDAFERAWDPAEHLPAWLADAAPEGGGGPRALGMFPVPEAFDLAVEPRPAIETHVRRVEELLGRGRPDEALAYLNAQGPAELGPEVRAFLACIALFVDERPREAFAAGARLWEEQPESLTAGYLEGVLHAELGRAGRARERFVALTEAHPEAWEPWYGLTSLHLLERRPDEALDVLARGQRSAADPAQLHRLERRLALLARGPAWERVFEADALHFRIRSDTDAPTVRRVARQVEAAWRTYERLLGEVALPAGDAVPLFLFSGEASFRAYAADALALDREHVAGVFSRALQALLVWNAPADADRDTTLRHEVLHQYLDARMGALPTWLNEGLCEYYERVDPDDGTPALGEPHPDHVRVLGALREVPRLRAFVRLPAAEFYDGAEVAYALAWGLVHFLQHSTPERRALFAELLRRLDAGEDERTAVDGTFRNVDWEAWDRAFGEHLDKLTEESR